MKHEYFMSYSHTQERSFGYGSVLVTVRGKLTDTKLKNIQKKIEREAIASNVVILSITRID